MRVCRLDKFLAQIPLGSRSQVKDMIKAGRVSVNGETAVRPEWKIDPARDRIEADGRALSGEAYVYYMLNKPAGVITATKDGGRRTVLDLLEDRRRDLFPVGRLDLDTEGLLLITNDGKLGHALLSPRRHVDKTYYVETDGPIPPNAAEVFAGGVELGDFTALPARLELLGERRCHLTIQEGKFHQVKRMFASLGVTVTYLKRISMGSLTLDGALQPGEYRSLTERELENLRG